MARLSQGQWISLKGLEQLDAIGLWLTEGFESALYQPKVMRPFINGFARGIASGGSAGGQWFTNVPGHGEWQNLSDYTIKVRNERGYGDGPMLVQSGQLLKAAWEPFYKWGDNTKKSSRSFTAPYDNFEPIVMKASLDRGRFHASISGSRVQNQYGGSLAYRGYKWGTRDRKRKSFLPRRPFWYMRESDVFSPGVLKAFSFALMGEWRNEAKGLRVI